MQLESLKESSVSLVQLIGHYIIYVE
jgi:hypothetical protein